jgi:hypothetical protein
MKASEVKQQMQMMGLKGGIDWSIKNISNRFTAKS